MVGWWLFSLLATAVVSFGFGWTCCGDAQAARRSEERIAREAAQVWERRHAR